MPIPLVIPGLTGVEVTKGSRVRVTASVANVGDAPGEFKLAGFIYRGDGPWAQTGYNTQDYNRILDWINRNGWGTAGTDIRGGSDWTRIDPQRSTSLYGDSGNALGWTGSTHVWLYAAVRPVGGGSRIWANEYYLFLPNFFSVKEPSPAKAQIVSVQYPKLIYINTLVPNIITVRNTGNVPARFGVRGDITGIINIDFQYFTRIEDYDSYGLPLSKGLLIAEGTLDNNRIAYFTLGPGEQKQILMGAANPYGCGGGTCRLWLHWRAGVIDQAGNWVPDSTDDKTFDDLILAP